MNSVHTLICDYDSLDRVQDYAHHHDYALRIIHVLWDDLWDRYIVLVDCAPSTYTLLALL